MRGRNAIAVALRHPDGRIVTATEHAGLARPYRADGQVAVRAWPGRPLRDARHRHALARAQCERRRPRRMTSSSARARSRSRCSSRSASRSRCSACCRCSSRAWQRRERTRAGRNPRSKASSRSALFLAYLAFVSRTPDIHRVFQYHGAEHMTIHALEAGDPLTVDAVRKYPTAHHRCGTEFLVILVLLSIFVFSLDRAATAPRHDP